MATALRGVLLVLLVAWVAPSTRATVGLIKKGIHEVVHVAKEVVNETEKIPLVGGVVHGARELTEGAVGTAGHVARAVGDKVEDAVQAGADAIAPDTPCYEPLGCFPMTGPWWSIDRLVPKPHTPEEINTRFYLYTRAEPERYYVQTRPDVSFENSHYDSSRTTFFITHGFASDGNSSWLEDMKDAILDKVDANVLLVDWGSGSSLFNYFQVASNTRVVGAETARVCLSLMDNYGMSPSRLHLIGHSLGAHVMSYVSGNVSNIARITGLDPAQPLFENFPDEVLLDSTDASFVDIVHTDAEPFIPFLGLGIISAYGHADFYVNGGKNQPGCSLKDLVKPNITSIAQLATTLVEALADYVSCPHGRSYEVWTNAVRLRNCTFVGTLDQDRNKSSGDATEESRGLLDRVIPMGLSAVLFPGRGSFNVRTTGSEPFCVEDSEGHEIISNALRDLKSDTEESRG